MKPTENPQCCPGCEGTDIDCFDNETDTDYKFEDWSCADCGFMWRCEFEFTKWEPL